MFWVLMLRLQKTQILKKSRDFETYVLFENRGIF